MCRMGWLQVCENTLHRTLIHLGSNTLSLRARCLNSYNLRETICVPSSVHLFAFLRAEIPFSHGTSAVRVPQLADLLNQTSFRRQRKDEIVILLH